MSENDNGDESNKHLEARDRRYSCLKYDSVKKCQIVMKLLHANQSQTRFTHFYLISFYIGV